MRIEDLSVNERILVHLKDFSGDPESGGASIEQTQEGIGEATGIRINHVPRATSALTRDGYIGEALVHIGGLKRKRKAFFLTATGQNMAGVLLSKLIAQKVAFRGSDGAEKSITVQDILFKARGTTASRLILKFFREGVILESSLAGSGCRAYISVLNTLPAPEAFVNRVNEIRFVCDRLASGQKLIIVSGMKGIGKTSLLWTALMEFEGKKNIFWCSMREWDTPRSFLEQVSEHYVKLGRNEVRKALRQSRDIDISQGVTALMKDMRDSESFLVIDNVFHLKRETMQTICLLAEQSRSLENSTVIIVTRDRGSCDLGQYLQSLGENDLVVKGLEREGAMKLMKAMGIDPKDGESVFAMTQGHPQAIRLVNSDEIRQAIDTKGLTKEEIWVVRCMKAFDTIFKE